MATRSIRPNWEGLSPGEHLLLPTRGKLPCKHVLFCGVVRLWDFGYAEIRRFAAQAMKTLAMTDAEQVCVAMTMHGVEYGLDEREAFAAQVAGLMEYMTSTARGAGSRS